MLIVYLIGTRGTTIGLHICFDMCFISLFMDHGYQLMQDLGFNVFLFFIFLRKRIQRLLYYEINSFRPLIKVNNMLFCSTLIYAFNGTHENSYLLG